MALHGFDKDDIIEYIPESERGSDDPCIIRLRFIPFCKVQKYAKMLAVRTKGISNQEKITEKAQSVQRKQFTDSVESVSGYYIGGREVTDPDTFYDTADTDLIYEIIGAMESASKLEEGQLKNSEPLSVSSKPKAASSNVKVAPIPTKSNETAITDEDIQS